MVQPGMAPPEAFAALEKELEAARRLLSAQIAVEEAMRRAAPGEQTLELVRAQENAASAAARSSLERRRYFPSSGSLDAWAVTLPPADAERARRLARDAREVKREIERVTARAAYVAQRAGEWTRAQLEILVRCAVGTDATYRVPGADLRPRRAPSLLDHTV